MSPGVPHIGYTYLNILDSPELHQILVTLTAVTAKLLRQGYRHFKLRKAFSKFYRRHSALLEKWCQFKNTSSTRYIGIRILRWLSKQILKKNEIKSNFSEQFRKLINRYKTICYSLDIMRQIACLVINRIIVGGYVSLFYCTRAVRASGSMTASS